MLLGDDAVKEQEIQEAMQESLEVIGQIAPQIEEQAAKFEEQVKAEQAKFEESLDKECKEFVQCNKAEKPENRQCKTPSEECGKQIVAFEQKMMEQAFQNM